MLCVVCRVSCAVLSAMLCYGMLCCVVGVALRCVVLCCGVRVVLRNDMMCCVELHYVLDVGVVLCWVN